MDRTLGLKTARYLILLSALFWGGLAMTVSAESFKTEVRVILASNSDQGFDSRLLDLKKDLLALNYMSFQLLDQTGVSIEQGKTKQMNIPGKRRLELTPTGSEKNKISMKVRIVEGKNALLTTQIRIENHGTVLIGGPPYQSGFLVLAVTAHFLTASFAPSSLFLLLVFNPALC